MQSQKKTKFPRVSEKQHLEIFKIDTFSVTFGFCLLFFFFTLRGTLLSRLTQASIIDEKKILIKYGNGVKDQTGWRNLIRRKDVNPALAQFALIFQKHEFLI